MAFDIKHYWAQVKATNEEMIAHVKGAGQQPNGNGEYCIWLYSLTHPDKGTHEGTVCEAVTKDAARRVVERTHRIATAEEVANHNAKMAVVTDRAVAKEQQRAARNSVVTLQQFGMLLRGQSVQDAMAAAPSVVADSLPEKDKRSAKPAV